MKYELLVAFGFMFCVLCVQHSAYKNGFKAGFTMGSEEQYTHCVKEFKEILTNSSKNDSTITGLVLSEKKDTIIYYLKPKK